MSHPVPHVSLWLATGTLPGMMTLSVSPTSDVFVTWALPVAIYNSTIVSLSAVLLSTLLCLFQTQVVFGTSPRR